LIIEKGKPGKTYHSSHPKKYSNLEIANKIGSYLGLENFIEYMPDRVFNDTTYPFFKEKDLELDTGWTVTKDLDDYLPETIEWYRKNLNLYKSFLT
jgi:dTDP-D-glucose 4,6-dehydratase